MSGLRMGCVGAAVAAAMFVGWTQSSATSATWAAQDADAPQQQGGESGNGGPELPSSALLPIARFFEPPDRTHVVLGPDADFLAWVAAPPEEACSDCGLWIAELDEQGMRDARPLWASGATITDVATVPGAEAIVCLTRTASASGRRLHCVSRRGGEAIDRTPQGYDDVELVDTEFRRANEVLVRARRRDDAAARDLVAVRIDDGEARLVHADDVRASRYLVDGEWTPRLAILDDDASGTIVLARGGDDHAWRELRRWRFALGRTTGVLGVSRDGSKAYLIDDLWDSVRGLAGLVEVPLADASAQASPVAVSRNWIPHAMLTRLASGVPIAACFTFETDTWKAHDLDTEEEIVRLRKVGGGDMRIVSRSEDDRTWVVSYDWEFAPRRYRLWRRDRQEAAPLLTASEALDGHAFAEARGVTIPMRDGFGLLAYATMPVGFSMEGPTRQPTVVLLRERLWEREWTGFVGVRQWLASRGYLVLVVNGRGSGGFGTRISRAGEGQWSNLMLDDLVDVVQWAVDRRFADPTRVAVVGTGLGGSAALLAMARNPGVFRCAAAIDAPIDLARIVDDGSDVGRRRHAFLAHAVGSTDPRALALASPRVAAPRLVHPVLLVAAEQSTLAPPGDHEQLASELRRAGRSVEALTLSGTHVSLDEPPYAAALAIERFLAAQLGGSFVSAGGVDAGKGSDAQ